MAELKTKPRDASVRAFIEAVPDEQRQADCLRLLKLMQDVLGEEPKMWGPSIVGFGSYHYKYASGHEGDSFLAGFSPRKQNLSVYIMAGFDPFPELMAKLGKYKTGKGCLYLKRLDDADLEVLKELIRRSAKHLEKLYPGE